MPAAASISSPWDRAIAYGDGLFESVLVLEGKAPLWNFHRLRLQQSLQRMGIHCDIAGLERSFLAEVAQHADALIKIIVARSGGTRGYDARQARDCAVQIKAYPLPKYSQKKITDGVHLHVCRQRLSHNSALAGMKHLNRLEQVFAASERQRDWTDEGLMLDSSGAVIECTSSNIFIVRNGILETPRLDHCGVAGVMRAAIMEKLVDTIPLPVREVRLTLTDVLGADTVFVCNSIFGVWPVSSIGVSQIPVRHEVIEKLWQQLRVIGYAGLYG
jgi:4-amino-4-deoxychorismate lyase